MANASDSTAGGGANAAGAPVEHLAVRMYKGLLGDCFLLRLSSPAGRSHVLIDCGVLQGLGRDDRMAEVAADIVKETNGRLDLLVVTHEHWDHISGFAYAADVFFGGQLEIGALWMGWTENLADPQAAGLRARFDKAKVAISRAAGLAGAMARAGVPGADQVTAGLEDFIGPIKEGLGAAGGRMTGRELLEKLKGAAGQVVYLEPGQAVKTPGAAALTAYVLGPPRTPARLFKAKPSAGDKKETYLDGDGLGLAENLERGLANRLRAFDDEGEPVLDEERPFPLRYHIPVEDVRGAAADDPRLGYLRRAYYDCEDWRRIDADWLGAAGALALKLDSNTNNTSLVLAFETPAKRVLLFAADAQVGNWLSWYDQDYGSQEPKVKVEDLLARTVLYKVGHHGSHNATLKELGLDRMSSAELVALIPVVEADATRKHWSMPYGSILSKLVTAANGRVLRGDAAPGRSPAGDTICDDQSFLDRVTTADDDLYVEYQLPHELVQAQSAKEA